MNKNKKRVIRKVYVLIDRKEDIFKICSTYKLANYYRKLYNPELKEDNYLKIEEYNLVHFKHERMTVTEEELIEHLDAVNKLKEIRKIIK